MGPDFGEISSNSYGNILFSCGFMGLHLLWPFDLWTQIHQWPKLGKVSFISIWDVVITRFLGCI